MKNEALEAVYVRLVEKREQSLSPSDSSVKQLN